MKSLFLAVFLGFYALGAEAYVQDHVVGKGQTGIGEIEPGSFCGIRPDVYELAKLEITEKADQDADEQCQGASLRTSEYEFSSRCTIRGAYLQLSVEAQYVCL